MNATKYSTSKLSIQVMHVRLIPSSPALSFTRSSLIIKVIIIKHRFILFKVLYFLTCKYYHTYFKIWNFYLLHHIWSCISLTMTQPTYHVQCIIFPLYKVTPIITSVIITLYDSCCTSRYPSFVCNSQGLR